MGTKIERVLDTPCIGYPAILQINGQIIRTSNVVDILYGTFGYIIKTKNSLYTFGWFLKTIILPRAAG